MSELRTLADRDRERDGGRFDRTNAIRARRREAKLALAREALAAERGELPRVRKSLERRLRAIMREGLPFEDRHRDAVNTRLIVMATTSAFAKRHRR